MNVKPIDVLASYVGYCYPTEDMMTRTIPEILKDKDMSQGELGRRAGLSRLTVYAAYRGKSVSLDSLIKMARALEVPLAEIAPEAAERLEGVA